MIEQAKDKEIAVRFKDWFGKRPDVLIYENDILELAKKKAISFHCSEELWMNPLQLRTDIKKQEMDELRRGWDLILDIDCHHFIYSKLAAHILVKILEDLGLKDGAVTCKFSGNKGFHLAVPFEAFPHQINGKQVKNLFPEAPRRIAYYLQDKLRPLLEKAILKIEKNNIKNIEKRTGIKAEELVKWKSDEKLELNVQKFLEIDTILIAPRHLYRMTYSFHEKSGLISVPVDTNNILKFKKEMSEPKNIDLSIPFLVRDVKEGCANKLFINAFDFFPKEERSSGPKKEFKLPEEAIREDLFPPCIKNMLNGMDDGRKRTMFTLTNFLRGAGWSIDAIEHKLYEWNKKNVEELREVNLKGQLHQTKKQKEIMPPHNCKRYYQDLQVCKPDSFCAKIKNPLQYAKLKALQEGPKKTPRAKLTDEQKEMRRKHREKLKKEKEEREKNKKI